MCVNFVNLKMFSRPVAWKSSTPATHVTVMLAVLADLLHILLPRFILYNGTGTLVVAGHYTCIIDITVDS